MSESIQREKYPISNYGLAFLIPFIGNSMIDFAANRPIDMPGNLGIAIVTMIMCHFLMKYL